MFTRTARFYDAVYSFKDYPKEAEYIHDAASHHLKSGGTDLLDVACGTGKHLLEFTRWYAVSGVDLDSEILKLAMDRVPSAQLHQGDMRIFELPAKFDVVTCLFSSVAYMGTVGDLNLAIANMARHLKPGGVLVLEPFLYPDAYTDGFLHFLHVDEPDLKLARMSKSRRESHVVLLDFHYLIGDESGVRHLTEHHELSLFTQSEYEGALGVAGLIVEYDPIGPMGRAMFLGLKPL